MIYKLNTEKRIIAAPPYSRSKFGRDAEITIALHIMSKGWDVKFSRGNRGPRTYMPQRNPKNGIYKLKPVPKLQDKGLGHFKIREARSSAGACPVLALLQPSINANLILSPGVSERLTGQEGDCSCIGRLQQFYLSFYNLINWSKLEP